MIRSILLCVLLVLSLPAIAQPQPQPQSQSQSQSQSPPPSQRETAIAITAELQLGGTRHDGRHVTLWVAKDSLDEATSLAFLSQLDQGVEVIREHLGERVDEPVNPRRLEVYLSPRVGIAHVRGDFPTMIYLPSGRVMNRTAPYLHELVHAVASWSWRHSEWLGEGLANHVAAAVEARSGGYHHSNPVPEGLANIAAHVSSPAGREIIVLVGPRGRRSNFSPEQAEVFALLSTKRRTYAPPFYAQSWSFVDFLVQRVGLEALHAHAMAPADTLDIPTLKQQWLASLEAD